MTVVAGVAMKAAKKKAGTRRRSAPAGAAPAAGPRPAEASPAAPATPAAPTEQKPAPEAAKPSGGGGSAGPFVLGVIAYAWVVLPLIQGGPTRMKAVWRAKFLNRGPKGEVLP